MRAILALSLILLVACTGKPDSAAPVYGVQIAAIPASGASSTPSGRDLILPLEVNMDTARTFVRLAYGQDRQSGFQSTLFLTPRLRTVQAEQLVRLVGDYNNFNGQKAADALLQLRGKVSGVEFGREGSPVIYIELPFWTHQREETAWSGQGTRISDSESAALVSEIRQLFVNQLKADEFSVEKRRVRIWWD
jgi:hypothetical protein